MKTNYSGFVLGTRKFKDNLKLVSLFTYEEGTKTFLIRVSKTKPTHQIYQPLNLITGIANNSPDSLSILGTGELLKAYVEIPFNAFKTTVALFVCEFIYRVLPEHYPNSGVYLLVEELAANLDKPQNLPCLVPAFMVKFCQEMGILDSAETFKSKPAQELLENLQSLIELPFSEASELQISREARRNIILMCIQQCESAFERPINIRSLDMFQEIFD